MGLDVMLVVALGAALSALLAFLVTAAGRVPAHRARVPAWRRAITPVGSLAGPSVATGWWLGAEGGSSAPAWYAALLTFALTLPWLRLTRRWSGAAHASWALGVAAGLVYLLAMAAWTVGSGLGPWGVAGAWGLWLLELGAVGLFLAYGYEIHDTLGSMRWERRLPRVATLAPAPALDATCTPFVSIHVPAHNEPPDLLIDTLRRLLALDYPAYEVLVIDNNTDDDALVAPVAAFCAAYPQLLRFHRLRDWPGYKSGALNYALTQTDSRAELVAVVDADYQVDPEWLRAVVPCFDDPQVGFVQTPQHYRGWEHAAYLRALFYSYEYFFAVSQPSRDERNAAIFGGTMGVIRRGALERIGLWDEWCITEDAELSLRLLAAGWLGHHVDQPFGAGVMPLTFEALKRQRFRWCFGGMQILRKHWRLLLPWSREGALTVRQRLAYLLGGVQWLGDLLGLLFAVILVGSLLDLALGGGHTVRRLGGLLLVAVPGLGLLGLVRAVAGMRVSLRGARWRDTVGAFAIWLSLGWVVAGASVRGLVEREGVFLRTPKLRGDLSWRSGVRANVVEVGLAVVAILSGVAAMVLAPGLVTGVLVGLLVLPVVGWLAAPVHSVVALRAELPAELDARRRGEDRRAWWGPARRWSMASLVAAGVVGAVVYAVLQPLSRELPSRSAVPELARPAVSAPVAPATQSSGQEGEAEQPGLGAGAGLPAIPVAPVVPGIPALAPAASVRATPAPTLAPAPVGAPAPRLTPAPIAPPRTVPTQPPAVGSPSEPPGPGRGNGTVPTQRPTPPPGRG